MIIMVSGAANRGFDFCGDFTTPARRQWIGSTPIWAADNGCFSPGFDADRFRLMLDKIAQQSNRPKFVTVPDVVGNHNATADRWLEWAGDFVRRDIPRAFVLQNGIECHPPDAALPWPNTQAIFIGGDTAFKFSAWVRAAVKLARRYGLWCHMGRVNSVKRMLYARDIGCHSCDGSGVSKFPNDHLPRMTAALRQMELLQQQ